jgi:hypothetical protein
MTIRSGSSNYGGVFFADGTTGDEQYRGYIQYNHTFAGVSDYMFFGTAGATKMTLDNSGNLGLGVTPSAWYSNTKVLQLNYGAFGTQAVSGTTAMFNNAYEDGNETYKYYTTNAAAMYRQTLGVHRWYTAASGTAGNAITFTQALTLDANGNLGIGTSSPVNKLSVLGLISASDSNFTASAYIHASPNSGANRNIGQFSVTGATNGLQVNWDHASSKMHIIINNIPTSSAGLPGGTLYSDGGTIKIA